MESLSNDHENQKTTVAVKTIKGTINVMY